MNYLWEAMIQVKKQGLEASKIRFSMAKIFSAYMEIANPFMNQEQLECGQEIEVNPYYRFYDIFKDLYKPEAELGAQFRENSTNLILHQLAENDAISGMTKEEYYKKLLMKDLEEEVYGVTAKKAMEAFNIEEQQIILRGLLRQYQTGGSLDLFREMMKKLIPYSIVYRNNQETCEILIYISRKREEKLEGKINFLIEMFIDLLGKVEVYYEYHFGIFGIDETMVIDEIALC